MANVDPFEIEFDNEQSKTEKPKRSVNAFERALKKLPDNFQKTEKPTMRQMLYNNPDDAQKFEGMANKEPEVPEIDTKVVDLPKEDKNEKELIVEHNDTATEPATEPSDTTIAEPPSQEENIELEGFDESEVIEPPTEENSVSGEEVGDIEPETPEDEPKKEKDEEEVMTDEEALAEAQEMAQDDLVGFKVTGKNWSKMTDKQKAEAIKAFKDKNKVEDHSTDIDNNETNNFESYRRYPTALRVAEDLAGAGGKIIEGAGDVAGTEIGGTGANMISERAKGVPHYDYTSLFGRR